MLYIYIYNIIIILYIFLYIYISVLWLCSVATLQMSRYFLLLLFGREQDLGIDVKMKKKIKAVSCSKLPWRC